MTAARDRWTLWLRVIDHGLVPPPGELAAILEERRACGDALWQGTLRREFEAAFPALFADPSSTLANEIRRVASAAYGIGNALHALHCSRDHVTPAGDIAMWLTLAAAGMDHLVDDGLVDAEAMRRYLAPARVIGALRGGPRVALPDPWVEQLLALGLDGLAACMRDGTGGFHRELCDELEQCIRTMLVAQLRSNELVISPHADLARVRHDLRGINTLTVWVGAYAGLFGHPRPVPEILEVVRRVATLFGDLGWALDALSDIHTDLEHGVFSLVWLELAESTGLDAPWLVDPRGRPELALAALAGSPVVERILVRIRQQLVEIERQPNARELGHLCRYMVAAFLYAEEAA